MAAEREDSLALFTFVMIFSIALFVGICWFLDVEENHAALDDRMRARFILIEDRMTDHEKGE